jgi:hypothetical protein
LPHFALHDMSIRIIHSCIISMCVLLVMN